MADTFEPNTVIYFKGRNLVPIVWGVFFYHVRVWDYFQFQAIQNKIPFQRSGIT